MYKPVIGLEIHAELKTQTKMFCSCKNDPDEKHPNFNICPVCMGHPGTLPVINEEAVRKTILAGMALNCRIEQDTYFERKNYFYPDLPKGYQISQYLKPLCFEGYLNIKTTGGAEKKIRITRIHLEEDAGRLYHAQDKEHSLVDYNRAGVPLMELVTEPDLESGDDVRAFAQELQLILRYLGVSDADMEKGLMRIEVNLSLKNPDGSFGTKVEVKNINSVKFAAEAVDYEIKRQSELLDKGGKVLHETRGWDEAGKRTVSRRTKEKSHDYRYFPEPDLPALKLSAEFLDDIKRIMPELPAQKRLRLKGYGINDAQAEVFIVSRHLGNYFEHVTSEIGEAIKDYEQKKGSQGFGVEALEKIHILSANYIITEFPQLLKEKLIEDDLEGFMITPEAFAELMVLIFTKELSSTGAKAVLKEMAETGLHPEKITEKLNVGQISDAGQLEEAVKKVLADNPGQVEEFKKGKKAILKYLVGMVMRETKGRANPQIVEELIINNLK